MTLIKQALDAELERLVEKYGFGKELHVVWMPTAEGIAEMFGERKELSGEVVGTKVIVYEHTLERALRTLTHEFFEYILHKNLVRPYLNLIEGLEHAYQKSMYENKEAFIEVLCDMEEEERNHKGEINKRRREARKRKRNVEQED